MDRRKLLSCTALAITGVGSGCLSSSGDDAVDTRSGEEVMEVVRSYSAPIGVEALDVRSDVSEMSVDERVISSKHWARDHVEAYDEAGERYREFLSPFVEEGFGLRDWHQERGYDDPTPSPWIETIRGHSGDEGWIERQAWTHSFEPGGERFKYVFGGTRSYDPDDHVVTFQGDEFPGPSPHEYVYAFDSGETTHESMAEKVLDASDRIWERIYEFFRAHRDDDVSGDDVAQFNEAVVTVSGCAMVDSSTCPDCGSVEDMRAYLNHKNRLALVLEDLGFAPEPL